MNDEIFDVKGASAFTKLHVDYIRKAVRSGQLKAAKIGGPAGHRFTKNSLLDWVERGCPVSSEEEGSANDEV